MGQTGTLARTPDGADLCDSGGFDPGLPPIDCDAGMDVCFVLDDTGSMGSFITQMKNQVSEYIETIEEKSGGDYQLGLVVFKDVEINNWERDECKEGGIRVLTNFSNRNKSIFQTKLKKVDACGGGGPPSFEEAVQTGVERALGFPWRSDAGKFVILLGDAAASEGTDACVSSGNKAKSLGVVISAVQAGNDSRTRTDFQAFTNASGGVYVQSSSSGASDSINKIFELCAEAEEDAEASALSAFSASSSKTVVVDPLLNVATVKAAKTLELPQGRYTAIIKNLNAKVSGKYGAVIRIQHISDGANKTIQFLDKGRFELLTDAKNAYEGLSLAFDHDGGDVHFYFPSLPNPNSSGNIEISIEPVEVEPVGPIKKQGLDTLSTPAPVKKKPKRRSALQQVGVVDAEEIAPFTCSMSATHLLWYEKGWISGTCCGLVVNIGGQDYIVFKRGIGDDNACGGGESSSTPCVAVATDMLGQHPAFAWPTFDGKTFAPVPSSESVTFRYDDTMSKAVQQAIEESNYTNPKGNPAGYRHLAYRLSSVLFPSS
jgi:hypothetical protein